jgi:hypothetical protein
VTPLLDRLPWRRLRARRRHFLAARQSRRQPDGQFLSAAAPGATGAEADVILTCRAVVARACGVPTGALCAADLTTEIEPLFGAECRTDFLLAIPLRIPECIDTVEFWQDLDAALSPLSGSGFAIRDDIINAAVARWRAGDALGSWAAGLSRQLN